MFENFQTINLFGTDGLHTKIVHITTKLILGPHDKPTCPKNTQPNQCVGCRVFFTDRYHNLYRGYRSYRCGLV
jgi:hypothetical protein